MATPEIYTLSLHDALPIWCGSPPRPASRDSQVDLLHEGVGRHVAAQTVRDDLAVVQDGDPVRQLKGHVHVVLDDEQREDRKSTRLNSSHGYISYAVFCLKK